MLLTNQITFNYMLHQTVVIRNKKYYAIENIPGCLAILGFMFTLGKLEYIQGVHTNYSMGIPVYICYTSKMSKNNRYQKILTKDYVTSVINAAPMHDIGKISTPDYILQKPGKLTAEEFEIMKKHSVQGGEIIKRTFSNIDEPEYQKITYEVARFHHEKWNGKGIDFDPNLVDLFLEAKDEIIEMHRLTSD